MKNTVLLFMSRLLPMLGRKASRNAVRGTVAILLVGLVAVLFAPRLFAQDTNSDPEGYKIRASGQFWYAHPDVVISGSSTEVPISFSKTFGFGDYSTFVADVDWHFKRKHHLLFSISPNKTSRTVILQQNITFRDKTFLAGSSTTGELQNDDYAFGYRYDILHRPRGHLGILIQADLIDIKGTITGTLLQPGQISIGSASGSVLVPLPVGGPDVRYYFLNNRLFVDANVKGMYFFGYGNFVSTQGKIGVNLGHHLSALGGYQLGSHLSIHGTKNRLDIRQTQRGPTAGLEVRF